MKKIKIKKDYIELGLVFLIVVFLVGAFTAQWPWDVTRYNSYELQARSWLEGRLDLGKNYAHLEIATYNGKHFISFPPFPSYLMLPLIGIFGDIFTGGMLACISFAFAIFYCYKIFDHFKCEDAVFYALFATICSNYLFVAINGWVWFIAQNLCFTMTVAAIYYALKGNGYAAFTLWACAVGCRPFTFLYLPFLIMICYKAYKDKEEVAETKNKKMSKGKGFAALKNDKIEFFKRLMKWAIVPAIIGISYMLLNYFRFGNPFEFGHNYLPEFLEAQDGQFSLVYIPKNLKSLFLLPAVEEGVLTFPKFNGVSMFLASPIFIIGIYAFIKGIKNCDMITITALICLVIELLCILSHKTMGGWHFGNRYTIDVIGFVIYAVAVYCKRRNPLTTGLAFLGLGLNFGWIIMGFAKDNNILHNYYFYKK